MHYPTNVAVLKQDLLIQAWPSFALESDDKEFLGFGQYYLRLERCHLCGLIVSPKHRGKGVVQTLIELIAAQGKHKLGVNAYSLFVYHDNAVAIKAYEKMGFVGKDYPMNDGMEDCLYMVKLGLSKF